ncbi:MAG: multicopper oxidase domain-containing protein, partial [Gemmatimonadetes bacterium]|nr:multicopper oxidase domain-containing protein [Gemmatimonadota bacterium]
MPMLQMNMPMLPGVMEYQPPLTPFLPGQGIDTSSLPLARSREVHRLADGDTLDLEALLVRRVIDGNTFTMYGFNGQYPGPLITVDQSATIVVNFTNHIDLPTTIHWHGVRLDNRFDGVPGVTQDPVQPGSLGIEAMIQALQFFMLERGMGEGIEAPRFEPLALGEPMTWKYRGQVVPRNETVQVTLDVTEIGHDESGPYAVASASLWCDAVRIYSADRMGMRIVSDAVPSGDRVDSAETSSRDSVADRVLEATSTEIVLDPAVDVWLADHCPTWNRPALPMMCIADFLARAVSGTVVALRDVQVKGFVDFSGARRLWTAVERRSADVFFVRLFANQVDATDRSDGVEVASGRVETGTYTPVPAALEGENGEAIPDPYALGSLFHGPAFQLMKRGEITDHGASIVLDAGAGSVPIGRL